MLLLSEVTPAPKMEFAAPAPTVVDTRATNLGGAGVGCVSLAPVGSDAAVDIALPAGRTLVLRGVKDSPVRPTGTVVFGDQSVPLDPIPNESLAVSAVADAVLRVEVGAVGFDVCALGG